MVSTHPQNVTQYPGEIVKQTMRKQHTAKEIAADNQQIREAQEAQQLATQNSINRVAEVEASIEIDSEQAGAIAKAIPIKPHPSADDIGHGTDVDCELEESEVKPKRKKKENLLLCEAVSAARLKKQKEHLDRPDDLIKVDQPGRPIDGPGKAHGLNKKGKNIEKKFSLSGQVNNWYNQVEPLSKGKSSKGTSGWSGMSIPCSTTDSRLTSTSVTSATTFSQAMEPPSSTPFKTLTQKAVLDATSNDDDDDDDDDNNKSDSKERAAIITEMGKGKAAMKTVIEIDSTSTDIESHAAPIVGHGKTKLPLAGSTFIKLQVKASWCLLGCLLRPLRACHTELCNNLKIIVRLI
ncbi:hypothetical protein EDD22DRAFT_849174 [Suillus occidentalis]|nr:hypothetical protein EDD22DRAFT_849174 [Suillus occidentalis]